MGAIRPWSHDHLSYAFTTQTPTAASNQLTAATAKLLTSMAPFGPLYFR